MNLLNDEDRNDQEFLITANRTKYPSVDAKSGNWWGKCVGVPQAENERGEKSIHQFL